jgi:pimeloyl-ACP methyl ester carboxylesterase
MQTSELIQIVGALLNMGAFALPRDATTAPQCIALDGALSKCNIGRAVLAGDSGSCFAARRVALDHPDRVAGLILEAAPTTLGDDAQ